MRYRAVALAIFWTLTALTVIVLALNLPDGDVFSRYSGPLILFALLTAFALFFGAPLMQGELSAAHAIGVLAALALPLEARATTTWAIAAGGLLGAGLVVFSGDRRLPWQRPQERTPAAVALMVARVTLSYYLSATFYTSLGGTLPVQLDNVDHFVPIISFCVGYTAFYLLLFLMEVYGRAYGLWRILRTNSAEIVTVLGLPLPLAVLGAHIYNSLSILAFAICMTGLALSMLSPYIISRAQQRLRKQVDELRSLSVMSQAIRANYEYSSLMHMVYVQVSNLLDINDFQVALLNPQTQQLEFPLVIRRGHEVSVPASPLTVNSPINRVLETQLPLIFQRDAEKEGWVRGLSMPEGVYSWLGVPLQAGGSLFGAMVVMSPSDSRIFTSDDLRLLNIVASSTSVALENSLLYEQQAARAQRLSALNTRLTQLTESLSPDAVLETIVVQGAQLGGAAAATVMLTTPGGEGMRLARSHGVSEAFAAHAPQPMLVAGGSGPFAPVLVPDVRNDVHPPAIQSRMAREDLAAWIELPLQVAGGLLGVLTLYYRQPQRFADEEVELLRAFATQSGQAIQNAREYHRADEALSRRVGQLLALATISHELTATLDTRTICGLVLEFALNATYTHVGAVMLKDEYGDLDVMAQYGYPLESVSRRDLLKQQVALEVVRTGEAQRIDNAAQQQDRRSLLPGIRSQLAVPIVRRGELLGVIMLESDVVNIFGEEDVQFITQLADQAVIAIDNTQLFQRIKEARDRLQLILDNMSEPLLLIDRAGTIALANLRVDKLGLHPDVLLGQSVESLLAYQDYRLTERLGFESPDQVRTLVKSLGRQADQEPYTTYSYKLEQGDTGIYLQRNIIPVRNDHGRTIGLVLVFYDETEAHELAKAREDLARMIIHDLRSPLTAVTTSLKLMNDIIPSDSEYKDMVETTSSTGRRAIRKLLNRVDSLLDVAKMESGQLTLDTRPTELATLMDNVTIELSPLAHELGVKVDAQLPDDMPLLDLDADKVERVLLNLLDNALKFSPEEGQVVMRAHGVGTAGAAPQFVRVDVVDKGPGVPSEYKTTLFNRFVQVRGHQGRRRGSGLGLTFCRMVVESHGGRIWVEDNPGGGSVFSFTLPVAPPNANGSGHTTH
jgi:signal transduction histidine kinase/putative methionine-R-sulfoxide reductase with GAF domain